MLIRRFVFGGIALAALIWLLLRPPEPVDAEPQFVQEQFEAMGTWFTVSIWLDDAAQRDDARTAIGATTTFLRDYARQWKPDGSDAPADSLAQVNAGLADGQRVTIPVALQPLLRLAEDWRSRSEGAFDARSGGLVALWGFDNDEAFRDAPPGDDAIADARTALVEAPGFGDDDTHYGPAPQVQWNLGGIAKGDALQRASQRLRDAGFDNHIINAGGDLVVHGERGPRAWRVAVRHPRPRTGASLLTAIETGNEAVFTSGDYERFFEFDGVRYHHIIDPTTGRPTQALRSVTVVDADAIAADAASTALFVAGDGWRAMARRLGMETVMVMYADGSLGMTETAEARMRLLTDAAIREQP